MNLPVPANIRRRPRVLNVLHAMRLIAAPTGTTESELQCIQRRAKGVRTAVEIGTAFGTSAVRIAVSLHPSGKLYCVDPCSITDPVARVCRRELRRAGVLNRVIFIRGFSSAVVAQIPDQADFIFVDGDHSYESLKTDWQIVLDCLNPGGIACFHDTTVPACEPDRNFGSVQFFNDVIVRDQNFELLETIHSLNALKRIRR